MVRFTHLMRKTTTLLKETFDALDTSLKEEGSGTAWRGVAVTLMCVICAIYTALMLFVINN